MNSAGARLFAAAAAIIVTAGAVYAAYFVDFSVVDIWEKEHEALTWDLETSSDTGRTFRDCETCPEMVVLPKGRFIYGSAPGEPGLDSRHVPAQPLYIKDDFAIGRFEITKGEWRACVKDGGCNQVQDDGFGSDDHPITYVTLNDAEAYVAWMSDKTGANYVIPCEDLWEFAARAGNTGPFSFGPMISAQRANYDSSSSYANSPTESPRNATLPVGSFEPNAFGLYDVHGNVAEWVDVGCLPNVKTSAKALFRGVITRGGSWISSPSNVRSSTRAIASPEIAQDVVGFRVARRMKTVGTD